MTKPPTMSRFHSTTIPTLLLILCCLQGLADEAQWKEGVAKLEKPLVDFRNNFGEALIRHSETLQNQGKIEDVQKMSQVIKLYESGDWPELDSRVLGDLDGRYIVFFDRLRKQFEKSIRSAAAKINEPEFNAMAEEKIKYWKQPWGPYKLLTMNDRLITYSWKVKGSFRTSGGGGNPAFSGLARKTGKEILQDAGITFQEGASAIYNAQNSTLTVRNQAAQMILVDEFLSSSNLH